MKILNWKNGTFHFSMIILTLSLCSSRCEKKCDFELSDDQRKKLLVYPIPSTLYYINKAINDTVILNLTKYENQYVGQTATGPYCNQGVIIRGSLSRTNQIVGSTIELTPIILDISHNVDYRVGFGCFNFEINQKLDKPSYSSISINSKVYYNIFKKELDTINYSSCNPWIWRVLFSLDSGIVAFYQRNDTNVYLISK